MGPRDFINSLRLHVRFSIHRPKQPRIFATGEPREVEVSYHPALVGGERNRFKAGGAGGADGGGGREQVSRHDLYSCIMARLVTQ